MSVSTVIVVSSLIKVDVFVSVSLIRGETLLGTGGNSCDFAGMLFLFPPVVDVDSTGVPLGSVMSLDPTFFSSL